jgi:hypothetical protein
MVNKYQPGQQVVCNGNPDGRILRVLSPRQYEVRLWQGTRHVGDVVTDEHDLDLENRQTACR